MFTAYVVRIGDKWHPAIKRNNDVWYWPNITYPNRQDAIERARQAVADLFRDAIEHRWNMRKF